MNTIFELVKKPKITEKSSLLSEASPRYVFVVKKDTNKNQIKEAIEKFYDVKVVAVRTAIIPGKAKRTQKAVVKKSSYKKAIVDLAKGQKIEFFKNV
jgi:large subunit ribosomal protein L23